MNPIKFILHPSAFILLKKGSRSPVFRRGVVACSSVIPIAAARERVHYKRNNGADIGYANGNRIYVEPAGKYSEIGISRFNGEPLDVNQGSPATL